MDPVSTNTDHGIIDSEEETEEVADLNTHLGDLQMGGGGDMLIDEFDPVDEKPDVAIITPEDSPEEKEPEVLANDCIKFHGFPRLRSLLMCSGRRCYETPSPSSTPRFRNRE